MLRSARNLQARAKRASFVWARERFSSKPGVYFPQGIAIRADHRADLALRYALARGLPQEAPLATLARTHLSLDTDVLELGAGIGILSATIRACIGAHARHLLVEPNSDKASLALENATGAMPERTELMPAALDYSSAGTIRFDLGQFGRPEETVDVPTTTLGALVDRLPGKFALICDIGGAERAIFRHGLAALARCDLLLIATHPDQYKGAEFERFVAALQSIGLRRVNCAKHAIAFQRLIET